MNIKRLSKKTWGMYLRLKKHEIEIAKILRKWIAIDPGMPDYKYTGSWRERFEYCSDRMNPGRARAILRLMGE